jgi:hypothetical protein
MPQDEQYSIVTTNGGDGGEGGEEEDDDIFWVIVLLSGKTKGRGGQKHRPRPQAPQVPLA